MPELELETAVRNLAAWRALREAQPWVADPACAQAIVDHASKHGVVDLHFGRVGPGDIHSVGPNHRENFHVRGLNARLRAVLECMEARLASQTRDSLCIYAPEAITPFARHIAERFANFQGSEYLPDPAQRKRFPNVDHQDLETLTFENARFDVILCNEVFEHLPDLDAALREIARTTKPGGWLISTFPFAYERENSILKARRGADGIEIIGEPEYHEDPVAGERGALVYEIPAWDVLARVESAGFRTAEMVFIASARRGLCARDLAGVFVLCAQR